MPDITNEITRAITILKVVNAEYQSCDSCDVTKDLKIVQRCLDHAIDLLKQKKRPNWNKRHDKV